ncbi:MAG TPA: methyltransferase domain-containing protein, partial [Chryseolinea sp.]|nr:methyltransferase domain-containing protein [Chryseolinea sp.]
DKSKAFSETFRILKPGGHFSVSDIVLIGELPEALLKSAEMYAGCVSGAIQKETYLDIIRRAGFSSITIQKEKLITIPSEIMETYLSKEEFDKFTNGKTGIYSVTVYAEKPGEEINISGIEPVEKNTSCCGPEGCK